jgi:hypothetical protein
VATRHAIIKFDIAVSYLRLIISSFVTINPHQDFSGIASVSSGGFSLLSCSATLPQAPLHLVGMNHSEL